MMIKVTMMMIIIIMIITLIMANIILIIKHLRNYAFQIKCGFKYR